MIASLKHNARPRKARSIMDREQATPSQRTHIAFPESTEKEKQDFRRRFHARRKRARIIRSVIALVFTLLTIWALWLLGFFAP